MSATLRYLSYVRRGMARTMGELADRSGLPTTAVATVDLEVSAAGDPIPRSLPVLGPGSVLGLSPGEVVRVDPPEGSIDAAPNLFPYIELRTAELPWLFTPARPRNDRLIPWLVLVVVEDREGVTLETGPSGAKLLSVDDPGRELPDLTGAWAWAHAQVHAAYDDLSALLSDTPELATARLLCPRQLESGTRYHACVVPSFEAGRLAGLGMTAPADSVALAWDAGGGAATLPVLHSWSFSTSSEEADFEELVRRLEPRPLAPDVGVHELDLSDPGTTRLPNDPVVVGYEGALGALEMEVPPWRDPSRSTFRTAMDALLDEATPEESPKPGEPYAASRHDPVVGPPRYGTLASGVDDIPDPAAQPSASAPRWLSEVNLDPKHRAAAGLGADVVRRNQEQLMADAWDQALGLGQVNSLLARTRLALEVGLRRELALEGLSDGALLQLTAGAHARLAGGVAGRTVKGRAVDTTMPTGLVSAAFRRVSRPGSAIARAVTSAAQDQAVVTGRMTEAFSGEPQTMFGHATLMHPFGAATPAHLTESEVEAVVEDVLGLDLSRARRQPAPRARARPTARLVTHPVDSVFGELDHVASGLGMAVTLDAELDVGELADIVRAELDPTAVLAGRLRALIEPAEALGGEPVPAGLSAAPELTVPLYRRVVSIDPELLLPGVGALPADSVGLGAINQASVEAFLLGANYELARELIWREYPADPAGTWLRTFWDSGGAATDIPPVSDWTTGALGSHPGGANPDQVLVLVIKGDLLRRYPNTLVTAVPAKWAGTIREEGDPAGALDPIFSGSLGPDAVFLGFEFGAGVDVDVDVPGSPDPRAKLPGWYFAFEEPPTEPSYGLDTPASDDDPRALDFWKDLTWADARRSPDDTHVSLDSLGSLKLPYDEQGENVWEETWADSAAGMARITLQRPVRMLVHADQMMEASDG